MQTSRRSTSIWVLGVTLALFAMGCSSGSPDPDDSCPEARTCAGVCVDLQTDEGNCGTCGNRCAAGSTCEAGRCATTPGCGDGQVGTAEACDDGNRRPDDGCSSTCTVEPGYGCSGAPSVCATRCGDGVRMGSEACDDGNTASGDGCAATCAGEPGYTCSGTPSACVTRCGDGLRVGMEACDDGNTTANDGCGVTCTLEAGFDCAGTAPTVCATRCGDGLVRGAETCDDGNTRPGDGCGSSCTVESEFEAEPNETNGTANPLSWMPARVLGTLESSNDVDVYRFTLTRLTDLRIVTDDGSGPESCLNVDTYVRLMDERGDALAADDDSGLSFCSLLDPSRVPEVTRLRPGTYYVSVSPVLFRGTSPLPYGLSIHVAATCGDGDRTSTEVCDDGNTADGDSCNRFCQLPPTMEVEPNDTPGTASGPLVPGSISGGALSTASDVDLYRFTLTAITDVAVEVFDESGPESCKGGIDPNVAVLDAQGATVAYDDDDGTAWCPRLGAAWGDRALRRLRPGTWYVRVGASSFTAIPDYTVRLRYEAVCGDGSVSGSEECDGGNSCTSTCERIPVCGDGQLDSPEQCDDGNTTDGDSCSRTCRVEGIPSAEVEPNGNLSEADVRSVGAPPVRITGSTQLSGSFSSPQDLDVFRVEVAAPTVVRFETFHGGLQRCAYTGATRIRLFPASGSVTATSSNDGIEQCSALLLHLAAGVHYVEVSAEAGVDTPFAYILEVSFLASSGAETEPNESLDTATPLSITNGEGFVTATHRSEPDVDFYRLTVPTGGRSLRAEITEGSATERCESLGIDTLLTLRDANGTELVVNDDGGRGYCSRLDGRGSTPDDFGARNLAAGTYYLEVRSQPPSGDGAIFDYRLSVMLR